MTAPSQGIAGLAEKWRAEAAHLEVAGDSISAGESFGLETCADELDAALPALLDEVESLRAALDAAIEKHNKWLERSITSNVKAIQVRNELEARATAAEARAARLDAMLALYQRAINDLDDKAEYIGVDRADVIRVCARLTAKLAALTPKESP